MGNINKIIHQPVRLNILTVLHMDKTITFSMLKKDLNLSDWNLWTHLEKLEENEYIEIDKSFVDKKPRSTVSITKLWEKELIKYINTIEQMFKWIKK